MEKVKVINKAIMTCLAIGQEYYFNGEWKELSRKFSDVPSFT